MSSEPESGDRRDFSIPHEGHMRLAADPGRLILGPFAPLAPRFGRLSYIPDAPAGNRLRAQRKRPETASGDRRDFSIFPGDPTRLAIDMGRRILGPFVPMAPLFRRILYISDAPPLNLAPAPRIPPGGESGDRRHLTRYPGNPRRLAVDPGRVFPAPFAPLTPRFH